MCITGWLNLSLTMAAHSLRSFAFTAHSPSLVCFVRNYCCDKNLSSDLVTLQVNNKMYTSYLVILQWVKGSSCYNCLYSAVLSSWEPHVQGVGTNEKLWLIPLSWATLIVYYIILLWTKIGTTLHRIALIFGIFN